jgi:hypothetical protein
MNPFRKNFLFILSLLIFCCSSAWANDLVTKSKPDSRSISQATNDSNENSLKHKSNNDDSHLRLFYKTNTPVQAFTQEIDHRLAISPEQFSRPVLYNPKNGLNQYWSRLNQPQEPFQHLSYNDRQQYWPNNNIDWNDLDLNGLNNYNINSHRNRHTLFNLHYHGNSIDGLSN